MLRGERTLTSAFWGIFAPVGDGGGGGNYGWTVAEAVDGGGSYGWAVAEAVDGWRKVDDGGRMVNEWRT